MRHDARVTTWDEVLAAWLPRRRVGALMAAAALALPLDTLAKRRRRRR